MNGSPGSATGFELLTNEEMGVADRLASESGVAGLELMENAGRAVAREATILAAGQGPAAVLCGPGNNGGDGFVAARYLAEAGIDVRLCQIGPRDKLRGDAAKMARRYSGSVHEFEPEMLAGCGVIVDALFGAGLSRPLGDEASDIVEAANASGVPILAVDVPSGLDGTTGSAAGAVIRARRTVTFFRMKPAHVLLSGRELCGQTIVVDIGIPASVLAEINPQTARNDPARWLQDFPWPRLAGHKYDRGHAVVVSGCLEKTGAARLAARAALRIGAGLVTVASPTDAVTVNAPQLTAIMLESFAALAGLSGIMADKRKNAVLIGPGRGIGEATRQEVAMLLQTGAGVVLDADALTSYAGSLDGLADDIRAVMNRPVVMTPHAGEFARLLPDITGSKLEQARTASKHLNSVMVLKGPDTVIAAPDGRASINANAPPDLATAGSGDVLAGFITGLLAQRMPPFEAACAAVWLHGACASAFGPGLIAEDLSETLPGVLRDLKAGRSAGE